MTLKTDRRKLLGAGALAASALASPHIARAQTQRKWRCVTSWPKNLPGPGVSAERLARRIVDMSNGEIAIEVFPAGTIVPAFAVLDALTSGTVELGHTASIFWSGKIPVAPVFTTVPFGLNPLQHRAWLLAGGQALWDELYAPRNAKPFVGGNTGPSAAGWFRNPVRSLADVKGLRIRATGLGGEVYNALGATATAIPPADTYAALERGVIDAVELLAPMNDAPLGLARIARHYHVPGFNKPNGASEFLVRLDLWQALPQHLRDIIEAATSAEHDIACAEAEAQNGAALRALVAQGVIVDAMPQDVLEAARTAAAAVLDRIAAHDDISRRVVASVREAGTQSQSWSTLAALGRYLTR